MMMLGCVLVERTLFWVPTVRLVREEMAGPAQWKCFAKWISIVVICFARFFFGERFVCGRRLPLSKCARFREVDFETFPCSRMPYVGRWPSKRQGVETCGNIEK